MSLLNSLIPSIGRAPATRDENRPANVERTVKPVFEIKETPDAFGVTVYLPGVAKEGLEITAEESEVRVVGRRSWKQPEAWTALHRESVDAPFELVLAHDHAIDTDKIAAELRDGVVRISLPKHEAIKPRKVTIN
jgi:HSP20 family molecular chaperone IbpA